MLEKLKSNEKQIGIKKIVIKSFLLIIFKGETVESVCL